jgi:gliding motility-associated-like protein
LLNTIDVYGCTNADTIFVEVYSSFAAPDLSCGVQENGELTIDWLAIPGATEYEISLDGGLTWILANGVLSHTVSGLLINDIVNIMVQAVSNNANCPSEIASIQCQYVGCALTISGVTTDPLCWNTDDGSIVLSFSNGQAPVTYSLDNGFPQGPNIGNIAAGAHVIVAIDNGGCVDTFNFVLIAPDTIQLALQTDSVICNADCDGQAIAIASGGTGNLNYIWNTTPPVLVNTADNLCAGGYEVSVTDQNGCEATANTVIFEPTALNVQISSTITSCVNTSDGTATVLVSGGVGAYSFLWNDINTQNTATANNLATGNYCVTVTDGNNCTVASCVDVTTPNPLVINSIVETPAGCFGENSGEAMISVSGGTGPGTYSYQWDDPLIQTGNPAILLDAGIYNIIVTDGNGCSIAGAIEVTQPDTLIATINLSDVSCYGGNNGTATAIPGGGTGPFTYLWSDFNNQTAETAIDLIVGNYIVTVTDANGCTATALADVGQPNSAIITTVTQTFVGCSEAMESIAEVTASGGNGNFTYEWSSGSTTNIATGLNASAYLVTITDQLGCEVVDLINITELEPIVANISTSDPSCFDVPDGQLEIDMVSGGVGMGDLNNYNYLWNTTPTQNTAIINNLTGDEIYVVTVTDAQGCTGVESIILQQPSEIILTMNASGASCFGFNDGEASVLNVQGDNNIFTFQWDINTGNQSTQTANNLSSGIYFVTVTDTDGCSTIGQAEVVEPQSMSVNFDKVDNECSGFGDGMLTANVSGGTPTYSYLWENGGSTQTIDDLNSGIYGITITDANGCEIIDSSFVSGPPPITATVSIEDVSCFGERDGSIILDLQGGTPPYLFSLDQQNYSSSNILFGLTAGDYDVFVMDSNGCDWYTFAEVSSPLEFTVNAGPEIVEIELGDSVQLIPHQTNGVGFVFYEWNAPYEGTLHCSSGAASCFTPWSVTQDMIIYELIGIDDNGCEATDQITVRVIKDRQVHVPTGFSPNNDQINDVLLVHGKEGTIIRVFRVYDRWGSLVFEAKDFEINDPNAGWDGTFNGEEMNPGVFVWYLEAEYIDGLKDIYKGNTTLLK